MARTRVVWRKPGWQRWLIAIPAIALDVGMIALIVNGSAGAWQPWFFLVVMTLGTLAWWLPMTSLDDTTVATRTMLGSRRSVALRDITDVGYGGIGVWVQPATSPGADQPRPMVLQAVLGVRPVGGIGTAQSGGPAGRDAADLIRSAATTAGATMKPPVPEPRLPRVRGRDSDA